MFIQLFASWLVGVLVGIFTCTVSNALQRFASTVSVTGKMRFIGYNKWSGLIDRYCWQRWISLINLEAVA